MEKEQKTVTINGVKRIIRDGEAVHFTEQTLTAEQRAQARKNIGIYSDTEIHGQVGQIIQVSAVDADGKVTAVEAVDMPGGGNALDIDATLTESGKAADAKAVGDALANKQPKGDYVKSVNGTSPDANGDVAIESGGVSDYTELTNKPSINGVTLEGNKTSTDLGIGDPTDEQVASAVQNYLTEHPEATTTVQDGSVTPNKTTFLKQYRKNLLDLTAGEAGQLNYDGAINESTTSWVSGLIPAEKTVYYSSVSIQFCGLYLNGSFVARFNVYATTLDLTSRTEEFDSIRLSIASAVGTDWMFADGALPTTFISYDSADNLVTEVVDESLTKVIEDTASAAADELVVPVATGLTEELHDDVMVPYDWTQYEPTNNSNYTANTVFVSNKSVVEHNGRAYKISFFGKGDYSRNSINTGEMATLFHFRPVDGVYTEIGRYKFPSFPLVSNDFDLDFEVKAGDMFGINHMTGHKAVNLANKEYSAVYTDEAVSFTQAELDAGSNPHTARLFTVYIAGARDTAGKAQLAAEDGSMSVLRKADVDTAPLKNMLNPDCIYSGSLSADGTIATAGNAKWALIQVQPNTAYSYNRRDASKWVTKTNTYSPVCFYDENMVFLGSVTEDMLPFTPEMGKSVVTPDNCAYVAVTILPYGQTADYDASDIMQFERGTHNTQYEPYSKYVSAIKGIPLFRYVQKETQEYDVPVNLVVMGDSISSPGLGKWWTHILAKYSFESARNIGIGGMHWTHTANTIEDITFDLTQQGGPESGSDSNTLSNAVNLLIDGVTDQGWTKPDVVFIYCGINDRGMALDEDGLNYGDPEAAFEYTDDYSNLSYGDEKLQNLCGAFRFAMEKLYRAFPYVKVVVCTPMYTGNNSNKKVRALNKTIKECASWMGIPVFDLGYESYVYQQFEKNGVTSKYLGDALHPNETGGKLLADLIAHHLIARFGGKEFYDLEG